MFFLPTPVLHILSVTWLLVAENWRMFFIPRVMLWGDYLRAIECRWYHVFIWDCPRYCIELRDEEQTVNELLSLQVSSDRPSRDTHPRISPLHEELSVVFWIMLCLILHSTNLKLLVTCIVFVQVILLQFVLQLQDMVRFSSRAAWYNQYIKGDGGTSGSKNGNCRINANN